MNILGPYKGYFGSAEFSFAHAVGDVNHFHGEILFVAPDMKAPPLTYRANIQSSDEFDPSKSLDAQFKNAVDDYLRVCAAQGRSPHKTDVNLIEGDILGRETAIKAELEFLATLKKVLEECRKEQPTSMTAQKSSSQEEQL
jgi:hypothetical protein